MPKLVLIKHAKPLVDPSKTSRDWKLSEAGREQSLQMIDLMRGFDLTKIVSSDEPKAIETAKIIADGLAIESDIGTDLHEHDRNNVPHMRTPEFISAMAQLFKEPQRLVLGSETGRAAGDRIARAIDDVVEGASTNLAIVTHGTAIALFAQRRLNLEPFPLWRTMGTPSYLVIDVDTWKLIERVDRV